MAEYLTAKQIARLLGCCTESLRVRLDRAEFAKYRNPRQGCRPYEYKFTPEVEARLRELIVIRGKRKT